MAAPLPRRLSPVDARDAALAAAEALLVGAGPGAVTLKAVAARLGRTHASLLHHFGSADGLMQALVARLAARIAATIRDAAWRARARGQEPREVVDLVFDAFDGGGGGALASWMLLSGNRDALDPILTATHDLVEELAEGAGDRPLRAATLQLVLLALGDALLGAPMAAALGLPREQARAIALAGLVAR